MPPTRPQPAVPAAPVVEPATRSTVVLTPDGETLSATVQLVMGDGTVKVRQVRLSTDVLERAQAVVAELHDLAAKG